MCELKRYLIATLKLGLPAALFTYLLWSVDPADYRAFWTQPKRWHLLALAQLTALLAVMISFLRWRLLVRAFDIPFSLTECMRLGFLGYLLNFISFGSVGGDLFKAILVARDKPQRRPEAVASVLLDRALGLLGLVLLAWLSLRLLAPTQLSPLLVGIRRAAGFFALFSIAALVGTIYAGRWFERLLFRLRMLPWLGETLVRMARAVRLLRDQPGTIAVMLGASVLIHGLLSLTVYLVSHGAYVAAPSLLEHLMVVPPGMAAGALPLAPGGIGLQEGALAGLFQQLPVLPENFSGMLVATVYRLITISIAGIGVVVYVASHGREFKFVRNAADST